MVIGGFNMKARLRFSDMPDDLQVFLFEVVGSLDGEKLLTKLERHRFAVHELPITAFPDVSVWTDYRDRKYTEAMAGQDLSPVVVCGGNRLRYQGHEHQKFYEDLKSCDYHLEKLLGVI